MGLENSKIFLSRKPFTFWQTASGLDKAKIQMCNFTADAIVALDNQIKQVTPAENAKWAYCGDNKKPLNLQGTGLKGSSGTGELGEVLKHIESLTGIQGIAGKPFFPMLYFGALDEKFICLDFDKANGEMPESWREALKGSAVERSKSGNGYHAFFYLSQTAYERLKPFIVRENGNHVFRVNDTSGFSKGIDLFSGGVHRSVCVTGRMLEDMPMADGLKLENEDKLVELVMTGLSKNTQGKTAEECRLKSRELSEHKGEDCCVWGSLSSDEVLRLMKQRNYLKGEQGGLVRLMNGDKDFIEQHYKGDWSAADLALVREITYYTGDYDVIVDTALECELTKRKKGSYSGSNPDKWGRDDYIHNTVELALESRKQQGRTYESDRQAKETAKSQAKEQGRTTQAWVGKPYADSLRTYIGKGGVEMIMRTRDNLFSILSEDEDFKGVFAQSVLDTSFKVAKVPSWAKPFPCFKVGGLLEEHIAMCAMKLCDYGLLNVSSRDLKEMIKVAGANNPINPLANWANKSEWDGIHRLVVEMIKKYIEFDTSQTDMSDEEAVELQCMLFRKWLIQVASRALTPACVAEGFLMLEGRQGCGKTTLIKLLASWWDEGLWADMSRRLEAGETPDNVAHGDCGEYLLNLDPKGLEEFTSRDSKLTYGGKLIFFCDEMAQLESKHTEILKRVSSQTQDTVRGMYQDAGRTIPRVGVFAGAFNGGADLQTATRFLRDTSGTRRWWVLRVKKINVGAILQDLDQIWAEAIHYAKQGENSQLTDEDIGKLNHWVQQFLPYAEWGELAELAITHNANDFYKHIRNGVRVHNSRAEKIELMNADGQEFSTVTNFTLTELCEFIRDKANETTGGSREFLARLASLDWEGGRNVSVRKMQGNIKHGLELLGYECRNFKQKGAGYYYKPR